MPSADADRNTDPLISGRDAAGMVLLAGAWILIAVAFFVQLFTGVGSWDVCVDGNDSGWAWSVIPMFLAVPTLVLAEGILLWRGGIGGSRWLAGVAGVVTAAALAGVWALVLHHPYYDCPPGG